MARFSLYGLGILGALSALACAADIAPSDPLAWDASSQSYEAKRGETNAAFVFHCLNVSSRSVIVQALRPSCDCTVVRGPSLLPWTLRPAEQMTLDVQVDLRDRWDPFRQAIIVETSVGTNRLTLDITPPVPTPRERDQRAAFADRQAVFKGQCAECHLRPALGKTIEERYRVLCGTCHDSAQRAPMVPNIAALPEPGDKDYWVNWLRKGKPGTYMPAFAKQFGGPLTEEEIAVLLKYLEAHFGAVRKGSERKAL